VRPTSCIVLAGSVLLGACAHQGVEPPNDAVSVPVAVPYSDSIARRQQLAKRLAADGDLAAAAAQWQVLTILEPDDGGFRQELQSTRTAASRLAAANYESGMAALNNGESEEAVRLMLRVLALQPEHADAMKVLRNIETERIARVQGARANRVRRDEEVAKKNGQDAGSPDMTEYRRSYDLEQTIELFVAGDAQGGLRELHRYVKANPKDKVSRTRISEVVFEQAQKLDTAATRERAESLYQEAIRFRAEAMPAWEARLAATRKTLANEYYEKGMRAYRGDFDLAIKNWEACLKYNPQQVNCSLRLKEAQAFQKQLKRIEGDGVKR
jgi:tetratricopeptide (TPR) repeat protein